LGTEAALGREKTTYRDATYIKDIYKNYRGAVNDGMINFYRKLVVALTKSLQPFERTEYTMA